MGVSPYIWVANLYSKVYYGRSSISILYRQRLHVKARHQCKMFQNYHVLRCMSILFIFLGWQRMALQLKMLAIIYSCRLFKELKLFSFWRLTDAFFKANTYRSPPLLFSQSTCSYKYRDVPNYVKSVKRFSKLTRYAKTSVFVIQKK